MFKNWQLTKAKFALHYLGSTSALRDQNRRVPLYSRFSLITNNGKYFPESIIIYEREKNEITYICLLLEFIWSL